MTDALGRLPRGGFVDACRAALVAGNLDTLNAHAEGTSVDVNDLVYEFGAGSDSSDTGQRARAIALLALALAPATDIAQRPKHLSAAIALWLPTAGIAPPEFDDLASPAQVEEALRRFCEDNRGSRLGALHDIAVGLAGRSLVERGRAAVRVPVTLHDAPARPSTILLLRVRRVDGLLPGVYEAPECAFARRGPQWRSAEKEVSDLIAGEDPKVALRYTLWHTEEDDGSDSHANALYLDPLDAGSAALALAVACRYAMRRGGRPIGGDVVVSAAIGADRVIRGVASLDRKAQAIPKGSTRMLVESEQKRDLSDPDKRDRTGTVPGHVRLVAVNSLEEAVKAARQRVPRPVTAVVVTLILAAAIWAPLTQTGPSAADERRALARALPDKVKDEVDRLTTSNPDLVPLVRAEHALAQPSVSTATALFQAYRATAARTTTLRPRAGGAVEVNFTADGRYVLTGGRDGTVTSWDRLTGKRLDNSVMGRRFATVVGIEPAETTGLFAAIGTAGTLGVGEVTKGGKLQTVVQHNLANIVGTVSARFSADRRSLAVGTTTGDVGFLDGPKFGAVEWKHVGDRLIESVVRTTVSGAIVCEDVDDPDAQVLKINRETGAAHAIIRRNGASIGCPVWLGEDVYAAWQRGDRSIEIGSIRGTVWQRRTRLTLDRPVQNLDSVDIRGLASATLADGLRIIDRRGRVRSTVPISGKQFSNAVSMRTRTIALNRSGTDVTLAPLREDPVEKLGESATVGETSLGLAWSPEGGKLAVGLTNGNVALIDPRAVDREPRIIVTPLTGDVRAVEFDRKGRTLWVGVRGSVLRVDLTKNNLIVERRDLGGAIRDIQLAPDARRIAIAGFVPSGVTVLEATSLAVLEQDKDTEAAAVHWLDDERLLVATGAGAGGDSTPRIEVRDGELQTRAPAIEVEHGAGYLGFATRPSDPARVLAVGSEIALVEVKGFRPRALRTEHVAGDEITSAVWSNDGRLIALATGAGVDFRDVALLRTVGTLPLENGPPELVGHDGEIAATAYKGSTVQFAPFGLRAWSQEICDRTRLFLGPAQWTSFAGTYPAYRTPCLRPSDRDERVAEAGMNAGTVEATRTPTATEEFAHNVFIKNYTFGDNPRTTILDGSWKARCSRVTSASVPSATCTLSWNSDDHTRWTANGRFRGAIRIGSHPYKRFTWRFQVQSRCIGDTCTPTDPSQPVKRYVWKGTGINTPA